MGAPFTWILKKKYDYRWKKYWLDRGRFKKKTIHWPYQACVHILLFSAFEINVANSAAFLLFLYLFPMSKHFDSSRSHNIGKSVYGLPFLVSANTFLNNRAILLNCNWFIVLRALAPSEFSGYCCPLYLMTLNWCASDFSCWLIVSLL